MSKTKGYDWVSALYESIEISRGHADGQLLDYLQGYLARVSVNVPMHKRIVSNLVGDELKMVGEITEGLKNLSIAANRLSISVP